jgi:alpha-tubulin suppressor-like RCC1 family protein
MRSLRVVLALMAIASATLAVVGIACSGGGDGFECTSDAQCLGEGVPQGRCEINHSCSFPDPACPSGRRFGLTASGGVGGLCVAGPGTDAGSDTGVDAAPRPGCAIALATGGEHTCALRSDHTVWCWGGNEYGQLGDGTATTALRPIAVTSVGTVDQVAVGGYHTCARKGDQVQCWGRGDSGQLGNQAFAGSNAPVTVQLNTEALGGVIDIGLGSEHSCALRSDGSVVCWGSGPQLGNGGTTDQYYPQQVYGNGGGPVTAARLFVGARTSCVVASDAAGQCWGANENAQLGAGAPPPPYYYAYFIGRPAGAMGPFQPSTIGLGSEHGCAVAQSTVYCWGADSDGQLGQAGGISNVPVVATAAPANVTSLAVGDGWSCALSQTGIATCWGRNDYGQLSLGDDAVHTGGAVVLGQGGKPLAGIVELKAGYTYACARLSDNNVFCWGGNAYGQVGNGNQLNQPVPLRVELPCP